MFGLIRPLVAQANTARNNRDWPAAEVGYRRVLERNPNDAPIWVQLGHTLKEQGAIAEALVAYQRADQIAPDQADTLHQIGRMLRALGDNEAAFGYYDRALHIDKSIPGADREAALIRAILRSRHNPRFRGLPDRLRYVMLGTTGT